MIPRLATGDKNTIREQRRFLKYEALKWGPKLREFTPTEMAEAVPHGPTGPSRLLRAWRSREFIVHLWLEPTGFHRLTIHRAHIDKDGQWEDGITWDQMQRLKAEAGFGDRWAVEVFPCEAELVHVSNLRHLFLMDVPPPYAWRSSHA